jgi:hypothetical protein
MQEFTVNRVINRCIKKDDQGQEQCARESGHRGDCHFGDGIKELEEAAKTGTIKVETAGDLNKSLGIDVLFKADYEKRSILLNYRANCIITFDNDGLLTVEKSHYVPCSCGIEAVTEAVRRAGGTVTFGVGTIRISGPEAG